jgi:hypothetical protein
MKKQSFVKLALSSIFFASVVIIGCSKTSMSKFSEKTSGSDVSVASEPGAGNPKFQECPTIGSSGITPSSYYFKGAIVGLGNAANRNATLRIVASIKATPECVNPGNKVVEAQSRVFDRTIDKTYAIDENGHFDFDETTTPIAASDFGPVCPNGRWELRIKSVELLSWELYVDGVRVTNTTGNITCN